MVNPILVALDVPTAEKAVDLAETVAPHVGGFKVGLELLMGEGPGVIAEIAGRGYPVFVDAKLHDIPNTVARAARALGEHGARWVTAHALGGRDMMEAAVDGLAEGSDGKAGVLAVTVLTSVDEEAFEEIGFARDLGLQVLSLAALAESAGAEGVVCSVHEVEPIKGTTPGLIAVTPGIRPPGASPDDQRRVATPARALEAGADYLVIGRPITASQIPAEAARAIAESI